MPVKNLKYPQKEWRTKSQNWFCEKTLSPGQPTTWNLLAIITVPKRTFQGPYNCIIGSQFSVSQPFSCHSTTESYIFTVRWGK